LDLGTIISAITAIGVAVLGYYLQRQSVRTDKREELKAEGALIQLEMTQAELKLSKVTAKAVMNQKLNGDVEEAMNWVRDVEIKYADYLRRVQCNEVM
jgi:hypothetical protein